MLELLSLLIFCKNKNTFSESESTQKKREEKTKKKKWDCSKFIKSRYQKLKIPDPLAFVTYLQNPICNLLKIFSS